MTTVDRTDFDDLAGRLSGRLAQPGDADWDTARQAFNLTIQQRPAVVAFPSDEEDAAEVVRFARRHGLRVAPQSTGHNAGPLGSLDDTVLLKTSEMRGVEVDVENRRARVRAGARWEDVVPRASEEGLAALHGSAPDVGIIGYSLGGGMGWYSRKYGLATNSVTAVELVTADGESVRADAQNEPELFWALRGGGGSFGVVTALEFSLYPVDQVYAGALFFPFERSAEVLHAWHEWVPSTPVEALSVARMMQFPPIPDIPEPMRGNSFAVVELAYLGGEQNGVELIAPLRDLGPQMDTFAMVPPAGLAGLHMDPPEPVPYASTHRLLGDLPSEAIDELVAVAGPGSESPLLSVELRQLGGAMAADAPGGGALSRLDGSFALFGVGMAMSPEMGQAVAAHAEKVTAAVREHDAGTFSSFVEEPSDARSFFPEETYERLQRVKGQYDPDDLFKANHPITGTA